MCCAADEVGTEIVLIGVTDGATVWLSLMSRYYVARIQWGYGLTYDGPVQETADSVYAFSAVDETALRVQVASSYCPSLCSAK